MSDLTTELQWEQHMIDQGVRKYLDAVDAVRYQQRPGSWEAVNDESATSYGVSLMKEVTLPFEDAIREFVDTAYASRGALNVAAGYLARCDARVVAYIATKTIIDSISTEVKQTELIFRIAGKLEDQMRLERFDEDFPRYFKAICEDMKQRGTKNYRHKRKVLVHCHGKAVDNHNEDPKTDVKIDQWIAWPKPDRVQIGLALLELFIMATDLVERITKRSNGKTTYFIVATQGAVEFIGKNIELFQYLHPEFLPMLIPPKDWSTPFNGGYVSDEMRRRRPMVKIFGANRKAHTSALCHAEMPAVYDAVNTAQRTAWRVNEFVFEQATEELKARGIGCPAGSNEPMPESPVPMPERGDMNDTSYQAMLEMRKATLTPDELEALGEWKARVRDWHQRSKSNKGKMLGLYNCHKIARLMLDKERFYYVHTLDSRGRLYPVGVHLTPQGSDMAKGMLQYAEGTALGRWGYWHLCIHAAGVFGIDKVSLEDRVAWIHDHKQRILDTWQDPAQTREFWGSADKPYLFLAVCRELAEVWMFHGTQMLTIVNKEGLEWIAKDFKSHVPCSQDGSCNGTQHFSAMLRDPVGAYSVNMTSATSKNVPCDIYGEVSQLAKENIKKDLALGEIQEGKERKALTNEEHYIMEVWLRKLKVDRKVAKRSTMIIPYGGQKTSCLNDIKEVLADRLDKMEKAGKGLGWDHNRRYRAAVIMHHYIWAALDVVVVASRKAMLFLSRIAGAQLSTGKAIRWTTPLGFPGYQEYKDMRPVTVRTKIFGSMIVKYSEATDETNQAKMRNAFAPNFVHSMDATHLMMTVNKAYEMGIENMALVHDSYAAPAGQCELFHKIIREQFVELYTPNRLLELLQEQRERNPRLADKFPTMDGLEPGDYDLNEVTNAPYFFR